MARDDRRRVGPVKVALASRKRARVRFAPSKDVETAERRRARREEAPTRRSARTFLLVLIS